MTDRTSHHGGDDAREDIDGGGHARDGAVAADAAELMSRLQVIEAQTLNERAAAYTVLHDTLTHTLESGRPRDGQQTESPRPHA